MTTKTFFMVVWCASAGYLPAMNLDGLSSDLVGNLVEQLTASVQAAELINKKVIPVIVYDVKALSLTNKSLYHTINDTVVSNNFINALAKQFDLTLVDAIGEINTPGARECLKNYLQKTGEYALFKSMQQIITIAHEISAEFEQFNLCLENYQKKYPGSVEANRHQTKQGIFLCVDSYPQCLFTPWGEVALFGTGGGARWVFDAFYQAFLKRLKTSFVMIVDPGYAKDRVKYYELPSGIDLKPLIGSDEWVPYEKIFNELSKEEVQARKGKETLISCLFAGYCPIYKIHEIDGQPLPEPGKLLCKNYCSKNAIKLMWNILQDWYKQGK